MSIKTYTFSDIVESVKRIVKWSVISGSFTDADICYYVEDAYAQVQVDYTDMTAYTITIVTDSSDSIISPAPDVIDKMLLALKASFYIADAYYLETIGDAILIRAGSISLDTSKSLEAHGINLNYLKKQYDDLVMSLNINGKSSDSTSIGNRVDNYVTTTTDITTNDSLITGQ